MTQRTCRCRDQDSMRCSEKAYLPWAIYSDNYDPQPCCCPCHDDPEAWAEPKPKKKASRAKA